jgi:hypothetical protein
MAIFVFSKIVELRAEVSPPPPAEEEEGDRYVPRGALSSVGERDASLNQPEQDFTLHLRGAVVPPPQEIEEEVEHRATPEPNSHLQGTLCIYQGHGVSCATRKTKPGKLQTCSRDVDDGICMNFPSAGAVFTCLANAKVNLYDIPGCQSNDADVEDFGCVDMTAGTYFLLCCAPEESNNNGCMGDAPSSLHAAEAAAESVVKSAEAEVAAVEEIIDEIIEELYEATATTELVEEADGQDKFDKGLAAVVA